MYVAVKGGEKAIDNAHLYMAEERRGDAEVPELSLEQIAGQLRFAVDRVMAEASLYDLDLAALAVKQSGGDLVEAIYLLRAYRSTLPRFGASCPIDTGAMILRRRISATFKDVPGGQLLGPTFDYMHRMLDFGLAQTTNPPPAAEAPTVADDVPRVTGLLAEEGLIEPAEDTGEVPGDLTREAIGFPWSRDVRLQNLARGDEGYLLGLAYSTQRGYGNNHPFAGEIRYGDVFVEVDVEEIGYPIAIGKISVTEADMINQFKGSLTEPAQFTRGYGLCFGYGERKAMAMALVDRALRAGELGEPIAAPAQRQEFVLQHSDNVEASGFLQHLKLPHYVDFQAELQLVRRLRHKTATVAAERLDCSG